ncbi:MAG: hypothetical protein HY013_04215, partial [Candidatus Solibacter usitatus]|nr:hypothetical protein [Candidatus Solibacter usitatus]
MGCGTLCLPLLIGACLQAAQFPIKTYTTADGLPRNFVTCFLQDSRGFLWVGTADGLARFDGRQFVTYDSERGLPLGRVFDLLESRSGFLWVATRRRLWRFPPGSSWPVYKPGDEKARLVLALLQDRSGTIWVGTDAGLFRFRESAGGNAAEAPELEWVDLGPPALPGLNVNALFEDRRGALWIAAENGLYRRQPDGHVDPFVANDTVSSLAEDRHGRLWIGTWRGGVARLVAEPVPGRPFVEFGCGAAEGLASKRIHFLVRLSDGRLLASTGDILEEMPAAGARSRCAVQRFPGTIGDGLYQDRQGNLWFGGETGASRVALNGFVSYSQVDGLGDLAVRAIAEDRAGDLIVVSRQIQINRFDGRRFTSVEPNLPG